MLLRPCTACCQASAIAPLHKPAGTPCIHLCSTGCSVYHQRQAPEFADCVSFSCLWLQGQFTDEDRPDKIGAVFISKPDAYAPSQPRIVLIEITPNSSQNPRAQQLIQ